MGSSDRYSANSSRRTESSLADAVARGDKYKRERKEVEKRLAEVLVELEKKKDECERLRADAQAVQFERQKSKEFREQRDQLLEENKALMNDNKELSYAKKELETKMQGLEAKYDHINLKYEAIKHLDNANPMSPLPERPKKSSPSSKSSSSSTTLSGGGSSQASKYERALEKDRQREMAEKAKSEAHLSERLGRTKSKQAPPPSMENYQQRQRRQSHSRTGVDRSRRASVDYSSVPRTYTREGWSSQHPGYGTATNEYLNNRYDLDEMADGNYHPQPRH